jgi:16S rRNA (cytidine1402-2'-O)-methyltransferase
VGELFVVATPIGNLEDVTLRALRVLGEVDLVLSEDTRRTRVLMNRHGLKGRPLSLHAHNEAARVEKVLAVLAAGDSVALVSDAGTPLVSDPGERLVAAVLAAGYPVRPVPGPSAVLSALAVAGLPTSAFTFVGFLPRRAGPREALLERLRDRPETLVLFEAPRRVGTTLRRLAEVLGNRPACVARELTKLHEQAVRGPLAELADRFEEGARGEVTIVVRGAEEVPAILDPSELDPRIQVLLAAGETAREIAAKLSRESGLPKRAIYNRTLELRPRGP